MLKPPTGSARRSCRMVKSARHELNWSARTAFGPRCRKHCIRWAKLLRSRGMRLRLKRAGQSWWESRRRARWPHKHTSAWRPCTAKKGTPWQRNVRCRNSGDCNRRSREVSALVLKDDSARSGSYRAEFLFRMTAATRIESGGDCLPGYLPRRRRSVPALGRGIRTGPG